MLIICSERCDSNGIIYDNHWSIYDMTGTLYALTHKGFICPSVVYKSPGASSGGSLQHWMLGHLDAFGMLLGETCGVTLLPLLPLHVCECVCVLECICMKDQGTSLPYFMLSTVKWSHCLVSARKDPAHLKDFDG